VSGEAQPAKARATVKKPSAAAPKWQSAPTCLSIKGFLTFPAPNSSSSWRGGTSDLSGRSAPVGSNRTFALTSDHKLLLPTMIIQQQQNAFDAQQKTNESKLCHQKFCFPD